MKTTTHKFQGGGWMKVITLDNGSHVVLGMSYFATNRGTAFSRNVGYASVQVELYTAKPMATYEEREYLLKFDIGHCSNLAQANKYSRQLIREAGLRKLQKVIAAGE
jgi:hypothetical protein